MPGEKAKSLSKGQKRKVSEMDLDEFMSHGFDSDVSTGDENGILDEKEEPTPQHVSSNSVKSKTLKHKDQLSRLKSKDPEFYKFLEENDEELLEFNDSETDDELQTDDSENEALEEAETPEPLEDQSKVHQDIDGDKDDVDDDDDDDEPTTPKKGKLVTMSMIKSWSKGLQVPKNSLASLKQIIQAFSCAVQDTLTEDGSEDEKKVPKYRVEGSDVFNSLIQTCLKNVLGVIQNHLGIDPAKSAKARPSLPSSSKKWSQVKATMKLYLNSVLQVLRKLSDPSMLCVVLRHTHVLCPYYASFPKITRAFVKRMVRMWSGGEEHVRVMAFVGINKLFRIIPQAMVDFSIKQLYTNFVKNCKFTSANTLPLIVFMQNSLVEIFSYNPTTTYQHGFVYIRQLAIHLRNALLQKKKESFQSVYNWQFIHCLRLWSRVLSEIPSNNTLEPLIYPLVQVTVGVIRLNPTSRYYPLRFHCVRSLNLLSQATGKFIPVAPYLLEILDSTEFNKETKLSTIKPANFSYILKVSKTHLHTKPFQDAVVDHVVELLLEHFSTHAHSIGFPELAFPCIVKMKQFVKASKIPRLSKQVKQIIEKLDETSQEVTKKRSTVSFSPKDMEDVEKWTTEYSKQPNAIVKFYDRWKSMKVVIPKQDEDADGDMQTEEEQTKPQTKKMTGKTKATPRQTKKSRKNVEPKKTAPKAKDELETGNDAEDIVEDFRFSDSDE